MTKFIKKEVLDKISYGSSLEQSLKQISLSNTPLELILAEFVEELIKLRLAQKEES